MASTDNHSPLPEQLINLTLRSEFVNYSTLFMDLPWDLPMKEWEGHSDRLEQVPRGISRHPVVFVNYDGCLYALKELPAGIAKREYDLLRQIEEVRLPAVMPVGYLDVHTYSFQTSILITRYLDRSLPYRTLFMRSGLDRYRDHFLDSLAGLMVQLHLAGVYWGDCSLSNTLFRRDAGALQAYLVDAETAEIYPPRLPPPHRFQDLLIMEENVDGEMRELANLAQVNRTTSASLHITGSNLRQRYQRLWDEVTREEIISPEERYRVQERLRALNALGFSVGEVRLETSENTEKLRLRFMVTDRNFHRDQLLGLTGMAAEEMQARQMMNEIQELKANLSIQNNRSTPLGVAAYHWLEHIYEPTIKSLAPMLDLKKNQDLGISPAELYCQVLEHKWYLSEQAHQDVGHQAAVDDYLKRYGIE
ncbi:MAG: DUF4032 domain-containing protein [Anaerolineales bacterium]